MPETDGQKRDALLAIEGHLAERGVAKEDLHAAVYAMSVLQAALLADSSPAMARFVGEAVSYLSSTLSTLDGDAVALGAPRWLKDPVKLPKDER